MITLFAYVPKWGNRALMINGVESLGLPLALSMLSGFILIAAVLTVKKNIVSIAIVFIVSISTLFVMIKTGSRQRCIGAKPQKKSCNVTERTGNGTNGKEERERRPKRGKGRGDGSESRVIVLSTIFQDADAVVTAGVQR